MNRKMTLILSSLIIISIVVVLFFVFNRSAGGPVRNVDTGLTYDTIQAALDANETLDGHTISVRGGVYNESIALNKAIVLIGEDDNPTIIDGRRANYGINVNGKSVTIKGFTIRNCTNGINLKGSNNSLITENNISLTTNAILVYNSVNLTIHQNTVGNNNRAGILVTNSQNFTISNNMVFDNGLSVQLGYGINTNFSANGLIKRNIAYGNWYDGIGLLDSSNCTVIENTVENNRINGVLLSASSGSFVYYNNIINNSVQAVDFDLTNKWDDGVEGNYWSNYAGVDSNYDGIGDTAQATTGGNQDTKPLMGMFHSFTASTGHQVNIVSNSTVTDFAFFAANNTIRIYVANASVLQSFGFCRLAIPKALIATPYTVTIDDGSAPVLNLNDTLYDNSTHRWIYFAYAQSTHKIDIVGTPP
ncbi:right-handed parallel beta-helix repeat-containing protein [Candidatus Bathyarchaeota archaeon]|nr:right-handed parallel beta-helix repeat-containing protein [Candidatus Bathyarchaeota archaeon]